MRRLACTAALALAAAGSFAAPASDTTIVDLERRFRGVGQQDRRLLGPLLWLHGDETAAQLRKEVAKTAEGGNGCFTAESRPHNDWLGSGWWRDLGICLDEARKRNLHMWLFDEKWWPSGEVGGKVPVRYGSKRLTVSTEDVTGPAPVTRDGYGAATVAVLAGRLDGDAIDGSSLVDLGPNVRGGTLNWSCPAGRWRVARFGYAHEPGRQLVDGASADCVNWYIDTVYRPHYDRFRTHFGKTIRGYFYDEPETRGDWGTEVFGVLRERGIDWKKALVAYKLRLAGEEQVAARYQYMDALAEAWGRTLYGGLSRWCRQRGVLSIGHFLEHGNCYLSPELCAGNMVQLMKYSDMGGIDAVFDQFVWGRRLTRDNPVWQTPKLGSSISHAYGKPDDATMVEIYGARGQDVTYPEMKWWLDHMQVSGVNFIIPHSFNPRGPRDTDCPPYFYNGGYEPRWPLYRVLADYSSRLSLMLTGGRHVCPVALLYLGQSAHAGRATTPEHMSEVLQDALLDCDWIPYDVFTGPMKVAGRELALRSERYRVLIVPPVETIPYDVLERAAAFFQSGGAVVGYGRLPSRSATLGRSSADIAELARAIWGDAKAGLGVCRTSPAGGRSYFLPEKPTARQIRNVLVRDAGVAPTLDVVEGETADWLHVLHRVKAGCDVFFVTNQDISAGKKRFLLRAATTGVPELWDPMRGTISSVPFTRRAGSVEVRLTLAPNESALLVCRPKGRALPPLDPGPTTRTVSLTRIPTVTETPPPLTVRTWRDVLANCPWVWYPEGDPRRAVPPGSRYFRRTIELPADVTVAAAEFVFSADNEAVLWVNGFSAGSSDLSGEGWRSPVTLDVAKLLRPGRNLLAIRATNGANNPNPAGLIGKLTVRGRTGQSIVFPIDGSWRCADTERPGWDKPSTGDAEWPRAREIGRFGDAPWGELGGGGLTLSPAKADPYLGVCTIAAPSGRAFLEALGIRPEEAARVTVNGRDAGGFIGGPPRLEISTYLRRGRNTVRIEPFAPRAARIVFVGDSRRVDRGKPR